MGSNPIKKVFFCFALSLAFTNFAHQLLWQDDARKGKATGG